MLLLLLACTDDVQTAALPHTRNFSEPMAASGLEAHVTYLASEALAGRRVGTEGDAMAVSYLEDQLAAAGFEAPMGGAEQSFMNIDDTASVNVLGVRWGEDPDVGDEIVVVGAHHDHLGQAVSGYYPGANDDGSGLAVLLGLAQAFGSGAAPDRTLVLAAWGSEEVYLDGSFAYVDDTPEDLPLGDTVFYVNLDMVGTYNAENTIYALDAVSGGDGRPIVKAAAEAANLSVNLDEIGSLSDSVNFCDAGVPELFFYTDDPECYHQTCDTADRLDYDDLAAVGVLVGNVVDALTDAGQELASGRAGGCPAG